MTDIAHNWSFGVYLWVIGWLCILMLGISYFLGSRNQGRAGKEPFESGIVSVGGARLRFSAKFYLVAMMFVIFDAEALFLYAWAVCAKEVGWAGFVEAAIFIVVLLVGLVYLWRVGGLDWAPASRRKPPFHKKGMPTKNPPPFPEDSLAYIIEERPWITP